MSNDANILLTKGELVVLDDVLAARQEVADANDEFHDSCEVNIPCEEEVKVIKEVREKINHALGHYLLSPHVDDVLNGYADRRRELEAIVYNAVEEMRVIDEAVKMVKEEV